MEQMGMSDTQFKFFLKRLFKDIEEIKKDINEDEKEKAIEKIDSLKEDIKTTIEDWKRPRLRGLGIKQRLGLPLAFAL